ncbi:MAG: DUF2851 family protein [Opitutaceae bacterium]|nr:DUF2851 family protein [Opitutaceae bacterium]
MESCLTFASTNTGLGDQVAGRRCMMAGVDTVEEMQGMDGPYGLSELVIQRIWASREYVAEGLRTDDGRLLVVAYPGEWNRGAGPDFAGAVFFLDGVRFEGPVEVHVRADDWKAHAHSSDPAYSGVLLHVVLFPSGDLERTTGWGGAPIPTVTLLPHLWQDLEAYAHDEALGKLLPPFAGQDVSGTDLAEIEAWAVRRWTAKVERIRSRRLAWGWDEAIHACTLEVLGHSANREPMLRLAALVPLPLWAKRPDEAKLRDWMAWVAGWKAAGQRPANQPLRRLRAYVDWVSSAPDWPTRLAGVPPLAAAEINEPPRKWWRRVRGKGWEASVAANLGNQAVGSLRWRTWLLDVALPGLVVVGAWPEDAAFRVWYSAPEAELSADLDGVAGPNAQERSNGVAQGLWALRRARAPGKFGGC